MGIANCHDMLLVGHRNAAEYPTVLGWILDAASMQRLRGLHVILKAKIGTTS